MLLPSAERSSRPADVQALFERVRADTHVLAMPLSDADATVQSMPDTSPAKWHLAHTTWFFERMVLAQYLPGYREFDERFNFLFNSYYETIGDRQPRPRRGMITRPSLARALDYRAHVDDAMARLLTRAPAPTVAALIELGCHHEQQHQELLLTDILHLLAQNPIQPAYKDPEPLVVDARDPASLSWRAFDGGIVEIGHDGAGFHFDCEGPRHRVLLEPYALADRQVTNAEWIGFIEDGGYRNPLLWLSAGWDWVRSNGAAMPLYWQRRDDHYWSMTLRGSQPVDPAAPVSHVSYFEADAFATWAGHRLPGEAEWEHAAAGVEVAGNFADSGRLRPKPAPPAPASASATSAAATAATSATVPRGGLAQMYGDTWQWTRSAFAAYPGFKIFDGAVGEYNGKFMCGQFVLRGGSCVTPAGHVRATYRNFFPADAQWQFSGLRLAKDV